MSPYSSLLPSTELPQRRARQLDEAQPLSMAALADLYDRSADTLAATDTPMRQAVTQAADKKDARTLAILATGGVPPELVTPLADHLESSRQNKIAGGGFEIFDWMRQAAKTRFTNLVSAEAPKGLVLERDRTKITASHAGAAALANPTTQRVIGRARVLYNGQTSPGIVTNQGPAEQSPASRSRSSSVANHRRPGILSHARQRKLPRHALLSL